MLLNYAFGITSCQLYCLYRWWDDEGRSWSKEFLEGLKHFLGLVLGAQREKENGGDERNRTADLLIANQTLSQLSYTPQNNQKPHKPSLEIHQELLKAHSIAQVMPSNKPTIGKSCSAHSLGSFRDVPEHEDAVDLPIAARLLLHDIGGDHLLSIFADNEYALHRLTANVEDFSKIDNL